jgi:hypothetical protein
MAITLISMVLLVLLGAVVGHMATSAYEDQGKIKRFVAMDQQHYERWKAYCELESRIQDIDRKGVINEGRTKAESFG